ncbi:hypothetical protein [Solitalea canadensis]|uniref:Uncharacterized protein n=1 Tax=Solitalea canadensis (strain ATCC 29591 / DSM 3403 / JCM 21819 / LMG 8368 / NBRC 15130 / NCIMB 12057 / USAM 9D) TaxID=929556 RepID=H8KNV2_SOLCM|nr:hypothetical protein [Solitalea canadensis]AFD05363.1 hypothetical protein Solca_0217 [Solitalea canadensis DSM 3403]
MEFGEQGNSSIVKKEKEEQRHVNDFSTDELKMLNLVVEIIVEYLLQNDDL